MKRLSVVALCIVAALTATSCSLRQPAVIAENFSFAIPAAARGPVSDVSISVLPFTAGPKASGQMLLYRADELRFEHDFYNRFLAPPPQMLTGAMRKYLSQARAGQVREPGAPLGSDLIVQPR
ncbi:MAG: hypothetical protein ACO3RX_07910, partial [Chthoniobacterales bacterium]